MRAEDGMKADVETAGDRPVRGCGSPKRERPPSMCVCVCVCVCVCARVQQRVRPQSEKASSRRWLEFQADTEQEGACRAHSI